MKTLTEEERDQLIWDAMKRPTLTQGPNGTINATTYNPKTGVTKTVRIL
jgi:hypothetical protein